MKRLFILIAVCMIGMVLPQSVFAVATVTRNGNTVTIKTDNAGELATYLQNADASKIEEISGATTIVFDGKFKSDDLNALRDKSCCVQETVDMSEAHFTNYEDMDFQNWKSTLTTAKTSKYMGDTDLIAWNMFSDCTKLQNLTLGSGNFNRGLGNNLNSLTTVTVKQDVTNLGNGLFNGKSSITTVTFEDGEKNLAIGEGCFNNCTGITSLTLPARLASLGKQAFANTTGVTSLSFHENSKITTIPEEAFKSCGNATQAEFDITIPRSVTEIQRQAFGDMWRLKKVRFTGQKNDADLVIKTGAFAGGTETNYILSDVFVDIDPEDRKLICEYGAFSYTSMEGQTNIDNLEELTTLHFTEDYWDYYAGNWKKGITFDQNSLNTFKDGCNTSSGIPVKDDEMIGTNKQIHDNNGKIPGKQPANGWQQFAKTSTGIMILPEGKFYRTYSTPVPLIKPTWMKIYRVKGFSDGWQADDNPSDREKATDATKEAYTEELDFSVTAEGRTYYCIPANTGVIRVDNRDKEAIFYILDWDHTPAADLYNDDWEYGYEIDKINNSSRINYLVPTLGGKITIGPVEKAGNTITHRIFGLKRLTESGKVPQFIRSKPNVVMGDHRAFLKLPADVFHWSDEQNGSNQNATGNDVVVDDDNTYAKISLFFDDDFEELNGGIATEIINSIEEDMYKNDSFYTLQGVKVAKPTAKGVYIHNGKKILIK